MTAETNPPNLDVDLDVTSPEFKIAHDRLVEVFAHRSARGTENPDEPDTVQAMQIALNLPKQHPPSRHDLLAAAAVDYAACTALLWLNNETLFSGGKGFAAAWLFAVLAFSEAAAYALLCCLLLHALRQTENDALADSLNRICRPICRPFSGLRLPRKLSALPPSVLLWLWLTQALPALTGRLNLWLIW